MDSRTLDRLLLGITGLLVVAVAIVLVLGPSRPEVPPGVDFVVERAADAAPPRAATRPAPKQPQRPPPGALLDRESGLQTWDIRPGTGQPPREGQVVAVDYVGWLPNGTAIDTTYAEPLPTRFVVGKGTILRGLDEGVREMRVGGHRQLVIPPELAFGEQGVVNRVAPNTVVTYEMELRDVWDVPEAPSEVDASAWQPGPQGVRFADVERGQGRPVERRGSVWIDYAMWANGTRVAHSFDRPAPILATLGAGALLPAWEAHMHGMRVGGRRLIEIPPAQAFGPEGRGEDIPPNATLVIEVVLRHQLPAR